MSSETPPAAAPMARRGAPAKPPWPCTPEYVVGLPTGLLVAYIGVAILCGAVPWLPDAATGAPLLREVLYLFVTPGVGMFYVLVGALLVVDGRRTVGCRIHRSVLWAVVWFCLGNMTLLTGADCLLSPQRPVLTAGALGAMWAAYTFAWLCGGPLVGRGEGS